MNNIRISVKAIILSDNNILLTKNEDEEGYFYLYPGGGQEHGETMHDTLKRECIEELGKEVEIGPLLHIREYIGKNHERAAFDSHFHQVEHYFTCTIKKDRPRPPTNPDSHQVGIEWIPLNELPNCRVYPKNLTQHINKQTAPTYLGDIN